MALDCSGCLFKYHNGSELGLCGYGNLFEPIKDMVRCPRYNLKGEKMNLAEVIGEAALLELAAEECAELAKELLKMARKIRGENPTPAQKDEIFDNIQEETADILLCIDHLEKAGYIVQDEVMGIYRQKEERMKKRLGGE